MLTYGNGPYLKCLVLCLEAVLLPSSLSAMDSLDIFSEMYIGKYEYKAASPPDLTQREEATGNSLLSAAIRHGYKELANDIIRKHIGELEHQNKQGSSPMHFLVRGSDFELFKTVFDTSPEVTTRAFVAKNRAGWSPLEFAAYGYGKNTDVAAYLSVVREYIDEDKAAANILAATKYRLLVDSIGSGDYNRLVSMLRANTDLINRPGPDGYGLICVAGARSDIAAVHILVAYGAKPEGVPGVAMNPVEWALHYKSDETLEALRIAGELTKSSLVWGDGLFSPAREMTIGELLLKYNHDNEWGSQ